MWCQTLGLNYLEGVFGKLFLQIIVGFPNIWLRPGIITDIYPLIHNIGLNFLFEIFGGFAKRTKGRENPGAGHLEKPLGISLF